MTAHAWSARLLASWFLAWTALGAQAAAAADAGPFDGEWRTSLGTVTLKQAAAAGDVTGTYGNAGKLTIKGTAKGKKLTFEFDEGQSKGDGNWTLDETGHAFTGGFKVRGGRAGEWNGWRPDPKAIEGKRANVGGLWLTNLGLMELEQTDHNVKGTYALRGTSGISGSVTGRRLDFTFKSFYSGKGWLDVAPDGSTLAGAANSQGYPQWYGWRGRKAPEFVRHAKLVPGKIVDGSTKGLLTYCVRAPQSYKEGADKKWPAVVILHGSNMNARAYVNTIANAFPDLAKDFLLIGINGEMPSNVGGGGKEPAFNYTYVNYMGRSTYKGFPGTDRESPALVAEALTELREAYPVAKYFVGGHSQGGFLTYSLLTNFPETIAGAFPISAGVIMQCEPNVFTDEKLRAAQRAVPLAIVHGRQDGVVAFSSGEYAATLFGEAGWPAFRFFADDTGAAHMFARLPVDDAVRWLEAQSSDDPKTLLSFAEARMKQKGGTRDAVAALNRARSLDGGDAATKKRLDALAAKIDAKASAGAKPFLPQPEKSEIDAFLAFRDDFEFAEGARDLMTTFNALRAEHDAAAKRLMSEANAAFQQGRRDEGYAKYQQIAEKHYAAASYRNVKRWLAERK